MRNLIIILNLLFLVFTIISCGNDNSDNTSEQSQELVKEFKNQSQIVEILKQPAMLASLAEKLEYVDALSEYISIKSFYLSTDIMSCVEKSNQELCQQILKSFKGNQLSFSSTKESSIKEEFSERYSTVQHGVIKTEKNTYEADLYFNCNRINGELFFSGKLFFHFPEISLLKGRPIVIEVKARSRSSKQ